MYDPEGRLLRVESAVVDYRRRFRFALAGYLILVLGVFAALYLITDQADDLEELNRKTLELVRHGQTLDCLDRQRMRVELGIAEGEFGNCRAIRQQYSRLIEDLNDDAVFP